MRDLTARQSEVYQFIFEFVQRHNYPPTVREIAGNFAISVKASHDHVSALKKKNKIKMDSKRQRTIELIAQTDDYAVAEAVADTADDFEDIPLLGEVAAGRRILADEYYHGSIKMHRSLLKMGKPYFALKVKGDSMVGIGVMDGDTVIIEKRETADNGDVVVVDIDEGRTLKRIFKQTGRVKLQSENDLYPPMYSTNVRILGTLVGVFRIY
jgi:repressor LexA